MPKIEIELNNIKLNQLIKKTNCIKQINICLSKEKINNIKERTFKSFINLYVIQLFCLFYKAFFENVLVLSIDLNIYEINTYFNKEKNPYLINQNEISKFGKFYKNIILGNLILMKNLTKISKISLTMYDSYQIELHQLMTEYFSRSINETNERKGSVTHNINNNTETNIFSQKFRNQFLFFQHILPALEVAFNEFNINFNSLDPLLFSFVNIALNRHDQLANIKMKFFNSEKVNNRKIIINSYDIF